MTGVAWTSRLFFSVTSLGGRTRGSEDKEDRKIWDQEVFEQAVLRPSTFIKKCGVLYTVFLKGKMQVSAKIYHNRTKSAGS